MKTQNLTKVILLCCVVNHQWPSDMWPLNIRDVSDSLISYQVIRCNGKFSQYSASTHAGCYFLFNSLSPSDAYMRH